MLINAFPPFEGGRGMIMDQNFNYNKGLKTFARQHRNGGTKAEIRLWCEILRNKNLMGYSFLRQLPIGTYIAVFFCKELLLVIETDGYTHNLEETHLKDFEKTAYFEKLGISFLRFNDDEVITNIENVRHALEIWIEAHPPTPFKGGPMKLLTMNS